VNPAVRWPLHPAPLDGEALSSWLRRIAATYQMTVGELVEHGLGQDPMAEGDLDLDPSPALLDVLAERTGVGRARVRQMCMAGWTPWLLDSLEARPTGFDTYVRQLSVLLPARKRSMHSASPWTAWLPHDRLQRACPLCADDPGRHGLLLVWRLPLPLSCQRHGCVLEPFIGFPGDYLAWTGDEVGPRAASDAVLAMDRRTYDALAAGRAHLPGRSVDAGEWFRLLRAILDEVSTPLTYWGRHAADLGLIWASCGHPVRAAQATWKPFERYPWPVQAQLLEAAATAIHLIEDGIVTGRGTHADLFAPARDVPVGDGRTPSSAVARPHHDERWHLVRGAMEEAVQAARDHPTDARALYDLLVSGCRTRQSIDQVHSDLAQLGIPTDHLSRKASSSPFS
jgi:hypothetical protein